MGDAIRITAQPDGSVSVTEPGRNTLQEYIANQKREAEAPQTLNRQHPTVRMAFNTETGDAVVLDSPGATRYDAQASVPTPAAGPITARNATGPVALSMAGPDTIVNLPGGVGETRAEVAVHLGYLVPRANGIGYDVAIPDVSAPTVDAKPQTNRDAGRASDGEQPCKSDFSSRDAVEATRDIPSTSPEVDTTLVTLRKTAPASYEGLLSALGRGDDITSIVHSVSRDSGDEDMADRITTAHEEYMAAGRKALSNMGVTNYDGFEQWATTAHPEEASHAVRAMVEGSDVAPLQALARSYNDFRSQQIVSKLRAAGIEAEQVGKEVMLTWRDGRRMSLQRATKEGLIEIVG